MVNIFKAFLATKLDAGGSETIIYLDRITTLTGETVATSQFTTLGRGILTVNPDGDGNISYPEYISFTTVSGTTVTGASRGLSALSNSTVTANKRFHPVGTPVVISFGVHNVLDIIDYVDDQIGAATIGTSAVVVGTAGETVAAGQLVYLKNDGKWWLCDADTASTVEGVQLGIAQGAGSADGDITNGVMLKGLDTHQSGLVAGTTYYASNTAGSISSSAGTTSKVIGIGKDTTSIYFDPSYNNILTSSQKDAMAGTYGTPSSSNKFVTNDDTSNDSADQSQTTQDTTISVGEADTTTKYNLLAQSFVPSKTSISGVKLYKSADTGTFTGTVKIALQADSSGSPSGSDLASVTLTNNQYEYLSTGEFLARFGTDYKSLDTSATYWIVITCSTSDTSNHPNLGANSAGGYASGSIKYKNTTDGWTAVSTTDLYFKTLEGIQTTLVRTNSSGYVPVSMIPKATAKQYTYMAQLSMSDSSTTITISHGLGVCPSLIKFRGHLLYGVSTANSYVSNTEGYATVGSDGTITYKYAASLTMGGSGNDYNVSSTNRLGYILSASDIGQIFTVSKVSEDSVEITLTKNGAPATKTAFYTIDIIA